MPVKNRIQFRRGTSAQWSGTADVLSFGEIGYDYEQKNVKVGNGTDVWDDLPWLPVVGVSGHIINPIVVGGVSGFVGPSKSSFDFEIIIDYFNHWS